MPIIIRIVHAFLLTVLTELGDRVITMGFSILGPTFAGWASFDYIVLIYFSICSLIIITPVFYSRLVFGSGWMQAAGFGVMVVAGWLLIDVITATLGLDLELVRGLAILPPMKFFAIYCLVCTFGFK